MSSSEHSRLDYLQWSARCSLKEGETDCGDSYVVAEHDHKALIAVIDGLGHGSMAAKASRRAVELLEAYNNQSLITLIKECHNGLRDTRGVVMGLALIDFLEHTMAWICIGNVDGVLFISDEEDNMHTKRVVQRSGIVGYKLPLLQFSVFPISFGDVLIFTTDGVNSGYLEKIDLQGSPKEIVNISSSFFKPSDDALIFAAKYEGNGSI